MSNPDWADEEAARLIPQHRNFFMIDDFRAFLAISIRPAHKRGYDQKAAEIANGQRKSKTLTKLEALIREQSMDFDADQADEQIILLLVREIDELREQLPPKDDGK